MSKKIEENSATGSRDEVVEPTVLLCRFCGDSPIFYTPKRPSEVCEKCFMVHCPKCDHESFWIDKRSKRDKSFYMCFSLECSWRSNKEQKAYNKLHI